MTLLKTGLLAAVLLTGPAAAADWPMMMQGPARAGHSTEPAAAIERFDVAWRFNANAEIRASPVAVGKQLFVAAENGNLYAIDLGTRKLQWLFHARGGIGSTPAVADGVVYFLSRDGRFHAVNAATGAPVWEFRTQGESVFAAHGMFGMPRNGEPVPDPWDLYLSSPLVHAGKVYFGSSDQHMYALDAKTGKQVWAYRTGGMVHSSPALAGRNIVVGSWDGAVYAFDAAAGDLRWRFQTQTEQKNTILMGIQASPSVDANTVYAGSRDGYFYAFDAQSGKLKWRYDAKGTWVVSTAAVDDNSVYFGTSDSGLLLALDKRDGKERYRVDTKVWTFASPLRVGDLLIGASMKGELFAVDAQSGRQRWSYRTEASKADAFGIIDADNGKWDSKRLHGGGAHALYTGMEHVKRLGAFAASPLWHQGQLIVASTSGEVLVFGARP